MWVPPFFSPASTDPGASKLSMHVSRTHSPKYLVQKASCGGREGSVRARPSCLGEAHKIYCLLDMSCPGSGKKFQTNICHSAPCYPPHNTVLHEAGSLGHLLLPFPSILSGKHLTGSSASSSPINQSLLALDHPGLRQDLLAESVFLTRPQLTEAQSAP